MTTDLAGEADRLSHGRRVGRPPRRRVAGRWARADAGEYDWWYELRDDERRYLSRDYMSDDGVHPDVMADWHGMGVDECMTAWARAILSGRRRAVASLDPLDDAWPELDDEEIPDEETARRYVDSMDASGMLTGADELVGPREIAERAGVTRSAVSTWIRRHEAFPGPVGMIGAERAIGNQGGGRTPIWRWGDVQTWLASTGRG